MTTIFVGEPSAQPGTALRLERRADGQIWATRDGVERAVSVRRCFPWSEPGRFVSLRDHEDEEFALVADAKVLDRGSRRVLEEALVEAGFVLQVTQVLEIEEEVEIRRWHVRTRQGPRRFVTRLDDWPRALPGGGLLLRDVAGDLYHLGDPAGMDRESRELLWAFVD